MTDLAYFGSLVFGEKEEHSQKELRTLSKRLAEETNGNFNENFYGGQLSKSKENLDGLKANSFEMAAFCNFYHPGKKCRLNGFKHFYNGRF